MLILPRQAHRSSKPRLTNIISPKVLFLIVCIATTAVTFWFTLMLLGQPGTPPPWPGPVVAALPEGTPQTKLSELPALPDARFSWLGIAGINAQVMAGAPAVSGHPILRLVALQDGVHTVAVRVNGLIKNERYRIMAWIRPQAGAGFGIGARDQADRDTGPNNSTVFFDLATPKILSLHGNGKPGIEQVGEWLTAWLGLPTTDGQYVVNFYVSRGDSASYKGDGKLAIVLGGTAAE